MYVYVGVGNGFRGPFEDDGDVSYVVVIMRRARRLTCGVVPKGMTTMLSEREVYS